MILSSSLVEDRLIKLVEILPVANTITVNIPFQHHHRLFTVSRLITSSHGFLSCLDGDFSSRFQCSNMTKGPGDEVVGSFMHDNKLTANDLGLLSSV